MNRLDVLKTTFGFTILLIVTSAFLVTGCDSTGASGGGGSGDDVATDPTIVHVSNLDTAGGDRELMVLVAPHNYDLINEFGVKGVDAVNDLHGMCSGECDQPGNDVSIELRTLSGEPFAGANGQSYTLFFTYEEGDAPMLIGSGDVESFIPFSHTFTGTGSSQTVNVVLPDALDYVNLFEYIDTAQVTVENIALPGWPDTNIVGTQPVDDVWDLLVVVTENDIDVPNPENLVAIAEKNDIGDEVGSPIGPILLAGANDMPWLPETGKSYKIFVLIDTRVWNLGDDRYTFVKSIGMGTIPDEPTYSASSEETWPDSELQDLGTSGFELFVFSPETLKSGKGDGALNTISVSGVTFTWFTHGVDD